MKKCCGEPTGSPAVAETGGSVRRRWGKRSGGAERAAVDQEVTHRPTALVIRTVRNVLQAEGIAHILTGA